MTPRSRSDVGKRAFDIVMACSALIVLSPLMVAIALALRWRQGPPVLYRQERPGLNGKTFTMYKFRTMRNEEVDAEGNELEPRDRTTPLGLRLRATSLDELPELLNVVNGDMSLVGPRPLLVRYLPRYSRKQARRHEVRPGITGLAQVSGRNALTWDEKFALDVRYVDEHDMRMDLDILFRTMRTVITREGVVHSEDDYMPEFRGSEAPDGPSSDDR